MLIFLITLMFGITIQVVYDLPAVRKYVKQEIRAAKMLNIITKYNIKPEGLEV